MAKSADAFRTISEVADWLDTPAHVLRFWESKFNQVKPVKRAGGRRYYRPADMKLLGGIKQLLHNDGMTIKNVQKTLREQGIKHVASFSQPLVNQIEQDHPDTIDGVSYTDTTQQSDPITADEDTPEAVSVTEQTVQEQSSDTSESVVNIFSDEKIVELTEDIKETDTEIGIDSDAAPLPSADSPAPVYVSTPDDPEDDIPADPGVLTYLMQLRRPVSDKTLQQIAPILQRLRQHCEYSYISRKG